MQAQLTDRKLELASAAGATVIATSSTDKTLEAAKMPGAGCYARHQLPDKVLRITNACDRSWGCWGDRGGAVKQADERAGAGDGVSKQADFFLLGEKMTKWHDTSSADSQGHCWGHEQSDERAVGGICRRTAV